MKGFGRCSGVLRCGQMASTRNRCSAKLRRHLSHKQQELLYRAWKRRGVDLTLMSRKTRRSRGAVRRAINMAQARRLIELAASGVLKTHVPPAFGAKDAGAKILSPAPVRTGLAAAAAPDVLSFLKQAHRQGPPIGAEETSRLAAYQFLRVESARLTEKLSRLQPGAGPAWTGSRPTCGGRHA